MILGGIQDAVAADGSKSAAAGAKLEDNLNRFLNILVTQLKNQDPLDPLDANEFTSQLVQFASVEQQIYQNSNLEKMLNLQETSQISSMAGFIGHEIEFIGNELALEDGTADFTYVMPAGVANATINILNSDGISVFTAAANTTAGRHDVSWDGTDKNLVLQPDGAYVAIVSGLDPFGDLVDITHIMSGSVTGAGVDEGKVQLFIGNSIIIGQEEVLTIKKITDPLVVPEEATEVPPPEEEPAA